MLLRPVVGRPEPGGCSTSTSSKHSSTTHTGTSTSAGTYVRTIACYDPLPPSVPQSVLVLLCIIRSASTSTCTCTTATTITAWRTRAGLVLASPSHSAHEVFMSSMATTIDRAYILLLLLISILRTHTSTGMTNDRRRASLFWDEQCGGGGGGGYGYQVATTTATCTDATNTNSSASACIRRMMCCRRSIAATPATEHIVERTGTTCSSPSVLVVVFNMLHST